MTVPDLPPHPNCDGISRRTNNLHSIHQSMIGSTLSENKSFSRVRFPDNPNGSEPDIPEKLQRTMDESKFFHGSIDDDEKLDVFDFLVGVLNFCLALVCFCGLMTTLVVLYLTVRPFSVKVYRRLASHLGLSTFLDAMSLLLPNTRLIVTGDSDIPTPIGSSILVCNHILDGDWWILFMLGRCVGCRGTMKGFLRNEFLHINLGDVNYSTRQPSSPQGPTQGSTNRSGNGSSSVYSSMSPTKLGLGGSQSQHQQGISSSILNAICQNTPSSECMSPQTECHVPPPDLTLVAKLLHLFLDFPLLNGEESGSSDREKLFNLLRSLSSDNAASTVPVHLVFFPEGWSVHNTPNDGSKSAVGITQTALHRKAILTRSNEFAKREGKPQLKCLLLPRTRFFNASLECLRQSNPFVYDVTLAYTGYKGSLPSSIQPLSITTLFFKIFRRKFPREAHIRIKRYSIEEVLHMDNINWLVKKWAEKDRLLMHFAKHQQFPSDSRGYYGRAREFNTRFHSLESSISSLLGLTIMTSAVPILILVSVPISWTVLWIWVVTKAVQFLLEIIYGNGRNNGSDGTAGGRNTPGSVQSASGTPFFPATPFASPNILTWNQFFSSGNDHKTNGPAIHCN